VTVELRTALGLKLMMSGVQVTIGMGNNPAGGTLSGTLTSTTDLWGEATFAGLSINKAGTGYTLMASSPGYSGAVSTTFAVTAAAASKLVITSPASVTGTASNSATLGAITVERQDTFGNAVTTGSTTVALASDSTGTKVFAASVGTASITTVTIAAGSSSASFFYGDTKAGTPNITAAASGLNGGSKPATITAAAAFKLAFGPTPLAPIQNQLITPAVPISILDTYGNLTSSSASVSVTSQCNLTGTLTATATAGVASFANLTFSGNGTNCTITATSALLQSATSNSFNVN
jgi:hypothetical protein